MCKDNCGCESARGFDQNDRIDAVRERIEKMVDEAGTAIEIKVGEMQVDVEAGVAKINQELFDGIVGDKFTGEDLQKLIVDGDMLSLDKLTEREDVQAALAATEALYLESFQCMIGVGGKVCTAENAIADYAETLWDDILIAGEIPDDIVAKLDGLATFIKTTIKSL